MYEITDYVVNVKRKRVSEAGTMHIFNKVEMEKERPGCRFK